MEEDWLGSPPRRSQEDDIVAAAAAHNTKFHITIYRSRKWKCKAVFDSCVAPRHAHVLLCHLTPRHRQWKLITGEEEEAVFRCHSLDALRRQSYFNLSRIIDQTSFENGFGADESQLKLGLYIVRQINVHMYIVPKVPY